MRMKRNCLFVLSVEVYCGKELELEEKRKKDCMKQYGIHRPKTDK